LNLFFRQKRAHVYRWLLIREQLTGGVLIASRDNRQQTRERERDEFSAHRKAKLDWGAKNGRANFFGDALQIDWRPTVSPTKFSRATFRQHRNRRARTITSSLPLTNFRWHRSAIEADITERISKRLFLFLS
jgi:hypothetical protein